MDDWKRKLSEEGYARESLHALLDAAGIPATAVEQERRRNELRLAERREDLITALGLFATLPEGSYYVKPSSQDMLVSSAQGTDNVLAWVDHRREVFELFRRLHESGLRFGTREQERFCVPPYNPMLGWMQDIAGFAQYPDGLVGVVKAFRERGYSKFGLYDALREHAGQVRTFVQHQEELFPFLDELLPITYTSGWMKDEAFILYEHVDALLALHQQKEAVLDLQRALKDTVGTSFGLDQLLRVRSRDSTKPVILTYAPQLDDVAGFFKAVQQVHPEYDFNVGDNFRGNFGLSFGMAVSIEPEKALEVMNHYQAAEKVMMGAKLVNSSISLQDMVYNYNTVRELFANGDNFLGVCQVAGEAPSDMVGSDEYGEFDGGGSPRSIYCSLGGSHGLLDQKSSCSSKLVEAVRRGPWYAREVLNRMGLSRVRSLYKVERLASIAESVRDNCRAVA